ncbi:MAG TPA: NHL repeat-containing protein [Fimbriimonadaceae bacterium]|nr:NHL repeat-containing protein [Fimbriimonadaceae bacterium]
MNKRLAFNISLLSLAACSLGQPTAYLVSNYFGNNISRYDAAGNFLGNVGGHSFFGPQAITRGPDGGLYVADENNHSIVVVDPNMFTVSRVAVATGQGGLNGPTGLAFDSLGNMLVASFNTDSVKKYNPDGQYLGDLTIPGLGGMNGPDVGIAVGPDGALYVPSYYSNQILRYNADSGAFLGAFANATSGLSQPRTILWRNGSMFVSSDNGNKVLRYDATTGQFLGNFVTPGAGGLWGAVGMTFDAAGDLLVTSGRNNKILRYSGSDGTFLGNWAGPANLNGPTYITPVPEPSAFVATSLGLLWLVRRKR